MTPKQFIRYTRWLDKKGYAICDGMTNEFEMGISILYPLFIFSGLSIFMGIIYYWDEIKSRIL